MNSTSAVTLTFGDQAENHVGMEILGAMVPLGEGFQLDDMEVIKEKMKEIGVDAVIHDLTNGDASLPPAYLMVMPNAVSSILSKHGSFTHEDMMMEQMDLNVDKQAFMYGKVVNKHARWNLCFDDVGREPSYAAGRGRIIAYDKVPVTKALYDRFGMYFGDKTSNLKGEGNYYYDVSRCGIGFHGDAERRKVLAVRLGGGSIDMPIMFQWHRMGLPWGEKMVFPLRGGDMYMMSEKAVGTDWKCKKRYTLRHAAGCAKFTGVVAAAVAVTSAVVVGATSSVVVGAVVEASK